MNTRSRLDNSFLNTVVGIISQIINIVLRLVVRTVFIKCLSAEYLGVNGLFTDVLTMLSLADLGIGAAIVFNMYKPLAEGDQLQIAKLMNLYRKAYAVMGIVVAVFGVGLLPFLNLILREKPDVPSLPLLYLLYLANTVFSYFFAYKRSIFSADQKERVLKIVAVVMDVARSGLQIVVILVWKNFIAYLVIQFACTFLENLLISLYSDRCYPFLKKYSKEQLDKQERDTIFEHVKATFAYKVGTVILGGTDNIIITAVKGVASVGLLSNYTLLTSAAQSFLNVIHNSVLGSIGNYLAKEEPERHERLLINVNFFNFLLYGVIFVGSIAVLNPFVAWWAGEDYVLAFSIVLVHCFNHYLYGTITSIWSFRAAMGLFIYGRWRPLVSALINVVVSIWWGREIGVLGVLLGTTFTRVVTNLFYDPWIVYKHGLKKMPTAYYVRWVIYFAVIVMDTAGVLGLQWLLPLQGIWAVLVYGCGAILLFVLSVILLFHGHEEFHYVISLFRRILRKGKKG